MKVAIRVFTVPSTTAIRHEEKLQQSYCEKNTSIIILAISSDETTVYHLRNGKHFPCFHNVIVTQVEVWENEKSCENTSRR